MLKICLCSDNHGDIESINKIKNDNPSCDYYFHLGDSELDEESLRPFITVKGNNDWRYDFPKLRKIKIGIHSILLIHGNGYTYSLNELVKKTIEEGCDTVFFGHIHTYFDEEYMGIRCINPGSTFYNRDLSEPCYAIVTIDDNGKIESKRINLKRGDIYGR